MSSKNRTDAWRNELVLLRGFAILGVLFLHSTLHVYALSQFTPGQTLAVFSSAISHGVPAFVFVSGFALTVHRMEYKGRWGNFYARRTIAILPSYVFFSIIYMALETHNLPALSISEFLLRLGFKILTGSAANHLWFIASVFQLYLLFPFLLKILTRFKGSRATLLLLALVFLLNIAWFMAVPSLVALWTQQTPDRLGRSEIDRVSRWLFLSTLFYFLAGILAGKSAEKYKRSLTFPRILACILVVCAIATVIVWRRLHLIGLYGNYYNVPVSLTYPNKFLEFVLCCLSIPVFCAVSYWLDKKKNRVTAVVSAFGQYSLGIYLAHGLFDDSVFSLLNQIGHPVFQRFLYPGHFLIMASLSYLTVRLLALLPRSEWIVGKTRGRGVR